MYFVVNVTVLGQQFLCFDPLHNHRAIMILAKNTAIHLIPRSVTTQMNTWPTT